MFLVISTEKLFSLNQAFGANPLFKALELRMKPCAKTFEISMPGPKISHPIPQRFRSLAPDLCSQIPRRLVQQLRPDSTNAENRFEIRLPSVAGPKSAVNHKPRTIESLCRALHLGDDFFRHRARRFFI